MSANRCGNTEAIIHLNQIESKYQSHSQFFLKEIQIRIKMYFCAKSPSMYFYKAIGFGLI